MAAIDDKMHALDFATTTGKSRADVRRLLDDAAEVAQGEKILLTDSSDDLVTGVARNFIRIQHAAFTVAITTDDDETTGVRFHVVDYMRVRDTVLSFIPVSPWSAPAYKTLKEFSSYVRERL